LGAVALFALGVAAAGHAHFAVSRRSLRALIGGADLVVHARLLEVDAAIAIEQPVPGQQPVLRVRVVETLKGPATRREKLVFAQHGHGTAQYAQGQEALLFLRDISHSSELKKLGSQGKLRWYSSQEHDDDWVLSPGSRKETLAAARRYVAIEEMLPDERHAALRKITVRLLTSTEGRLAKSALRDLASAPNAPWVTTRDVPALLEVIDDTERPIELRVGLLVELEKRGLVDGDSRWVGLLGASRGSDRLAVIPVAGTRPTPAVSAALGEILSGPDLAAACAAAVALGSPGNTAAIEPLSKALFSDDARLAMAAIRGLSGVGTPEAREAIAAAAASHPDPAVRRRAQAELRLR
jgi:hypothetical protein